MKSGNRYGYPPLRDLIVSSQSYDVSRDNVLVTLGTQLSNFLALSVLLEPGDHAIIDAPSWEQPRVLCEALHVDYSLIRRREELSWGIDLDELASLISPKTKVIYICQPNNPTGATFTEATMQALCDLAARTGIYVISDEIYRGLEWNGQLSPAAVNHYERGVTTSSVSKTLGMSGTRLGWLASQDRDVVERCLNLKYYMTLHQQSRLDETVAMAALEPTKYWELVRGTMDAARANFSAVSRWMDSNGVFRWVPPAGGSSRSHHTISTFPPGTCASACSRSPTGPISFRAAATDLRGMCASDSDQGLLYRPLRRVCSKSTGLSPVIKRRPDCLKSR